MNIQPKKWQGNKLNNIAESLLDFFSQLAISNPNWQLFYLYFNQWTNHHDIGNSKTCIYMQISWKKNGEIEVKENIFSLGKIVCMLWVVLYYTYLQPLTAFILMWQGVATLCTYLINWPIEVVVFQQFFPIVSRLLLQLYPWL